MALSNLDKDNVRNLMEMIYKDANIADRNMEITKHCHSSYAKVTMLAEQIRHLNVYAKSIIDESMESHRLHTVKCNFKKVHGKVYHFYVDSEECIYCSMISPEEWGTPPHRHYGSYRLGHDNEFVKV